MDDLYVECLVERKPNPAQALIKGLVYGLTVISLFAGVALSPVFFIAGIGLILVIWLVLPMLNLEFEYLYVSKSLTVDKIFSKEKRKKAAEYDLEKMEIFAEKGAYQLDEYKNIKTVDRDYTSHIADRPVWILIVRNGNDVERLYLEPNEKLIDAMKSQFPRKTFSKI